MPSTITHTYLSVDVYKKLEKKPQNIILKHIEDYKTFSQGMDILYFYHIFLLHNNKINEIGHKFHNYKTNEIFKFIIEYNKKNKQDIIFTFLCGLINHYTLDSTIHPYINYLSYKIDKNHKKDMHFEIETFLDNYMLSKNYKNYNTYKNYKLQFNNKYNQDIIKMLNELFITFFKEKDIGKKYYRSLTEMKFVFKYIRYDKYKIKRKLYSFIDTLPLNIRKTKYLSYNFLIDDRYLNNKHNQWYNIDNPNQKSNKSFDELYQDSIIKAVYLINNLYNYIYLNQRIDLDNLLGNLSYGNGLPL